MYEVLMPKMGETMETGTIEKWRKQEGDKVEKGDILYDLATDKVSLEVESFYNGILRKIVKAEGAEVPIMEVIAYIGEKDEKIPGNAGAVKAQPLAEENKTLPIKAEAVLADDSNKEISQTDSERISISPIAKNMAKSNNIDISKIKGSGPSGRIVKEDIEEFISSKEKEGRIFISPFAKKIAQESGIDFKSAEIKGTGPEGRIIKKDIDQYLKENKAPKENTETFAGGAIKVLSTTPLKGIRKIIAERMVESKQNIPHILMYSVCDVTNIISLRNRLRDKIEKTHGIKITYTDFLVKITAAALSEFKGVNSSLQNNNFIVYSDINIGIGVAVSASNSLIVPTIYNADKLGVLEIAKQRTDLVEKGRNGKLGLDEISNATFTISNLGMYGVRSFTAIINPPQGAIMMVSEMYEAPVVINGKLEISTCMEIGVAVDHRIIDGALGAQFLQRVKELVENPEMLML